MNIKRFLLTVCLLLLLSPCAALAAEEPIIYTVKQGDTLWDISQRFIKDPYYWPNLWAHNPDIGNPHLIFPGQKLRIYDGRIEIIPITEEGEELPSEEGIATVTPEEVQLAPTYNGATSFLVKTEPEGLGTLVDTVDNRILIGEYEKVFLEMNDLAAVQPGDVYSLGALGKEVSHPITGKRIGYQLLEVGTVKVQEVTPTVAVAEVTESIREIQRGAKVFPHYDVPDRIPRKISFNFLEGTIVAADEGKLALGQWDVIHIDLGTKDGLEVGDELELNRKREATKEAKKRGEKLQLPDIRLGEAIVLETRDDFAEALITRIGNLAIYRGDHVQTKTR